MVRGGQIGGTISSRKKAKPIKRRYDVALGATGAEMRLPALPSVRFGWRLVSGLLVGILAFTLYTLWNSPMYRVSTAEVEGLKRLNSQDINAVANVAGKPIFVVDPRKVRQDIQASFLELADVSVDVKIPAKVLIVVEERQPVLAWEEESKVMWVDAKGVAFPPRGEDGPSILVKAENSPLSPPASESQEEDAQIEAPNRFLPPQLVSAALAISLQAPQGTPLVYTGDHGLGWKDPRGWEVYFGMNLKDMEMKLRVYQTLVKRLGKEKIQPKLISVEYVHAPYYRLEP
jgi:cell division protein FtsQ